MNFELRLSKEAGEDLERIYLNLFEHSPGVADRFIQTLMSASAEICASPLSWAFFRMTGAPRRARLIRQGRIAVWIIYRVRDDPKAVEVLRFWDSRQNPSGLGD